MTCGEVMLFVISTKERNLICQTFLSPIVSIEMAKIKFVHFKKNK